MLSYIGDDMRELPGAIPGVEVLLALEPEELGAKLLFLIRERLQREANFLASLGHRLRPVPLDGTQAGACGFMGRRCVAQRGRAYRGGCVEPGIVPGLAAGGNERTRSRSVSVASTHARIDSLPSHRTATTASPLRSINRAPRPAPPRSSCQ